MLGESPGTPKRPPALTAGQWQLLTELLCNDPATPELGAVLIIAQMGIVTPKWSCHPLRTCCYLPDREYHPLCPHTASVMSPKTCQICCPQESVQSLMPWWTLPCPHGAPCPHLASGMSPRGQRAPCPHADSVLRVQEDACAQKSQDTE